MDLFGEVTAIESSITDVYKDFLNTRSWSIKDRLHAEKETLGLYLTGHPIDEYEQELEHLVTSRIANLKPEKSNQTIAGLIISQRVVKTKRGDNLAIVTIDDRTGRMDVTLFSEIYNSSRDLLLKDGLLVITGQVKHDDFSGQLKMSADKVQLLSDLRQDKVREIHLQWHAGLLAPNAVRDLMQLLQLHRGSPQKIAKCPLIIDYSRSDAKAQIQLGPEWLLRPEDELLQSLRERYGLQSVSLVYQ